jgi:hypothetical protein
VSPHELHDSPGLPGRVLYKDLKSSVELVKHVLSHAERAFFDDAYHDVAFAQLIINCMFESVHQGTDKEEPTAAYLCLNCFRRALDIHRA